MSLLDALLNEGYRDPRDIYIALRADGQKGSGTIDDPYSGTSVLHPAVTISTLNRSGTTATAVTSGNHGFANGDLVTISRVNIQLSSQPDVYYAGTFAITVTGSNSFTYTMLDVPSSSSAAPLSGGSIQCWREREQFDVISVPISGTPQDQIAQGKDGHDCVLEDCIAERPTPNPISNSSILLVAGGGPGGAAYYARGCAIRHCWVDTQHVYGTLVEIDSIAYSSGLATVTTKWPHGRSAPGNVFIQGALVNGSVNNPYNGLFKIEATPAGNQLTYQPYTAPSGNATGGTIGGGICKQLVVRSNVIRHVNGTLDPAPYSFAAWITYSGQALVEGNVISLNQSYPLPYSYSGLVTQENRSPSGTVLRGFNQVTERLNEELATQIEDAVISALL